MSAKKVYDTKGGMRHPIVPGKESVVEEASALGTALRISLLRVSAMLLTVVRKIGDAAGGEAAEGSEAIGTIVEESF